LRVNEEQRLLKEEEANELYRDVDINQGRGLQLSQDIQDSHVTLTLVHPDGQQESSSVSSFVTSMLNPISDAVVADLSEMELKKILIEKMEGNNLTELEYHLEEVYKATMDQVDWVNPKGQQYPHNLLHPLSLIPDNRGRRLSNLTVEERFAFNVSLRMFTRSIVIKRRMEDLQLGVKSYQKRLNLTKPDTYRSDLKRRETYTAYSNPRGFVYQNKDKKNMLMRIDKLYKFSDGTLNDVRNALDDRLKGIRMQYLPQTIWRKGDKDRVAAMIQAIDKMLKIRRIMRSLEWFVGGRLYEGDFRMLQRTI
nr:hypothetical protein [Tanacetum cinerariifolium]